MNAWILLAFLCALVCALFSAGMLIAAVIALKENDAKAFLGYFGASLALGVTAYCAFCYIVQVFAK